MLNCQYCNKECKNKNSHVQHERCCPQNPNRNYKNGMLGKKGGNQYTKAKELGVDLPKYDTTNWKRGGCAVWSREKRSEVAKELGFGGYRENAGRTKKFKVFDSFGNVVCLQSTYELLCSEILNNLSISWLRPKHLKYGSKKYFPDFYLPDFDIYLDPKNDFLAINDASKIDAVMQENNVKVFILTKDKINESFIKMLCS